jgi:hypothetical protein
MTNRWLTTFFFSPVLVFGALLVLSESSLAYQPPHSPATSPADRASANTKTAPGAKTANETYCVIQIVDEIIPVTNSEKAKRIKQEEDNYKSASKKYQDAKKDKNNHDPKPDKKDYTVKVLKAGFKTKDDAQKFADDKIQERDKGKDKKTTAGNTW